jgi:succinylglutamic semialdehyde dehydrogenase
MNGKDHFINGHWIAGEGAPFTAGNPSTGGAEWRGNAASSAQVDQAISTARSALHQWSTTPIIQRIKTIEAIADGYRRSKLDLTDAICRATGKPRWESAAEIDAMVGKAQISIAAHQQRKTPATQQHGNLTAATRFRPIGVLGILGPFNMPGHLPNGHLMPALLAGNTVVFKPSELTPVVGEMMVRIAEQSGVPDGVLSLIQGGPTTGSALVNHPHLDGLLFTGSHSVGAAIHRAFAGHPEKLLALEMGGNNPLIAWDCADLEAAAHCIIQSAFITAGQRCSCARRLIVHDHNDVLIARLTRMISSIRVALYTDDPPPFMGTVISAAAAQKLLAAQADLIARGGKPLIEMRPDPRCGALLSPGLIDTTDVSPADDQEIFGPLLQLKRVADFDAAITEANRTRFGLSAGLISDRPELYAQFSQQIRAAVLAFNRPMTGARSDLPFGGIGSSGNHRPSAYYAADYCCDPIAAVESPRVTLPDSPTPGIDVSRPENPQ